MGKTALVTGGNSGIGFATARLLKSKGFEVIISGRNKKKLVQAAKKLSVGFHIADMEDIKQLEQLASVFQNTGLDALVNNAALCSFFPIENCNEEIFSQYINTNIKGHVFLTKALIGALEKKNGAITNISSIITKSALPNTTIYTLTKGAIEAFTRSLAQELSSKNIRVNAVSPGAVDTPIFEKTNLNPSERKAAMKTFAKTIPLKRYAQPEEIAHVIVAQLESTYTTGSIWTVDGGISTR